ncbi:MAG: DegV family protein [Clostridia bacterium]
MEKIKISADSTSDLSKDIISEFDINIIPLLIETDNASYRDGIDITPDALFDLVENKGQFCHTTAVNAFQYHEEFTRLLKTNDAVIHICLSSDMSACYQNACTAAAELENVYVLDSKNLSSATGHLVYEAALMARDGIEPKKIFEELTKLSIKLEASFIIDTLEYLKRGGRCSAIKAFSAAVLKLKPCIEVIDGKMTVGNTFRGSLEVCLKRYVKQRLKDRSDIDCRRVFITTTGCSRNIIDMVEDSVKKYGNFETIIETQAGCTISAHCGPNTLGILFFKK